jgi:hypothetical protein
MSWLSEIGWHPVYQIIKIMQEKSINPKSAAIWENRWVRFRMALKVAGVEPRMHDYCRGWVLGFLGFIKPGKFHQAEIGQVEGYLQKLAGEGKEIWQVRQAEEALRIFYQEVEPTGWAKNWPLDLMRGLEFGSGGKGVGDAAPVPKPPTARGAASFAGRADTGECPEKYRNLVEAA